MLFDKFKQVKGFVFDVDGVLTDGLVLVTEAGEQLRQFYIKDGYALQLAVKKGYPVAVITGGSSEGVRQRMYGLGITQVFTGVSDKLAVLASWLEEVNLRAADILYMGDDIPDLAAMKAAGIAACPADAIPEIKAVSHYISPNAGGRGAVRDVLEKVLKLQGRWSDDLIVKSN